MKIQLMWITDLFSLVYNYASFSVVKFCALNLAYIYFTDVISFNSIDVSLDKSLLRRGNGLDKLKMLCFWHSTYSDKFCLNWHNTVMLSTYMNIFMD